MGKVLTLQLGILPIFPKNFSVQLDGWIDGRGLIGYLLENLLPVYEYDVMLFMMDMVLTG